MSDLIERSAVLDLLRTNWADNDGDTAMQLSIDDVRELPTVTAVEDAVSRQAVLDGVDRYIYKSQSTGTQDDFYSFAELVVKALPPVTPKPTECEDLISRKHLLSEIDALMQSPWFNNGKDDDRFTHYGYVERKEAVEIVRDLCVKTEPPVIPKPRTGKWIQRGIGFRCSECAIQTSEQNVKSGLMKYCPNCGARMEGEREC